MSIFANYVRLRRDHPLKILKQARQRDSEATRRLYQLIRSDKPYFDERIDPRDLYRVFVVEPQRSAERIRAQSSAFRVSAFHGLFESDENLSWIEDTLVFAHCALTIPYGSKSEIVDVLRLLNVSRETLFQGLDAIRVCDYRISSPASAGQSELIEMVPRFTGRAKTVDE